MAARLPPRRAAAPLIPCRERVGAPRQRLCRPRPQVPPRCGDTARRRSLHGLRRLSRRLHPLPPALRVPPLPHPAIQRQGGRSIASASHATAAHNRMRRLEPDAAPALLRPYPQARPYISGKRLHRRNQDRARNRTRDPPPVAPSTPQADQLVTTVSGLPMI